MKLSVEQVFIEPYHTSSQLKKNYALCSAYEPTAIFSVHHTDFEERSQSWGNFANKEQCEFVDCLDSWQSISGKMWWEEKERGVRQNRLRSFEFQPHLLFSSSTITMNRHLNPNLQLPT